MGDARRCDKCGDKSAWLGMSDGGELVGICMTCTPDQDEVYSCYGCDGSGKVRSYYGHATEASCPTCEGKGGVRFDGSGWNAAEMPDGSKIVRNAESTRIDRAVSPFAQAAKSTASELGAEQAEADDSTEDLGRAKVAIEDAARAHWQQVFDEGGSSDDSTDDGLTECFDCGAPTQRSGLFADADVYCGECADKHQSEKREQERIQLVDGYPGEWQWTDCCWRMVVRDGKTSVFVEACKGSEVWASYVCLEQGSLSPIIVYEAYSETENAMQAAAAIRPHAEAMVEVLEGMGDDS